MERVYIIPVYASVVQVPNSAQHLRVCSQVSNLELFRPIFIRRSHCIGWSGYNTHAEDFWSILIGRCTSRESCFLNCSASPSSLSTSTGLNKCDNRLGKHIIKSWKMDNIEVIIEEGIEPCQHHWVGDLLRMKICQSFQNLRARVNEDVCFLYLEGLLNFIIRGKHYEPKLNHKDGCGSTFSGACSELKHRRLFIP